MFSDSALHSGLRIQGNKIKQKMNAKKMSYEKPVTTCKRVMMEEGVAAVGSMVSPMNCQRTVEIEQQAGFDSYTFDNNAFQVDTWDSDF